ncbi:unnamed protein product (macronuclear) [Paramecium tetraurelia]|uniref:Uncharacterized protein n=1 Tax=Paramecium tetraurelia TaxID=5888 RepID=A0DWN1_PARTE|nr:uncharacterized protein GSPATT00021091001 [Paramecium tetraurelia]CAK87448.1 unnamed protein product [Paramecium tetraurelia]|eukprot:XP_001454845.1 hypothetical protein (macronuclear) [Paramecium tetraurelia strain d4-2]
MFDQQIKSLQCAALETQAYYDVYWQIPQKQAAAYNMLLDKFQSLNTHIQADFNQIQLHPQIMEILNYFNQTQTSVIPKIKETTQVLFLSPPSEDPKQHYIKSIERLWSLLLNKNLQEDLCYFEAEKQVFQNLNNFLQCKGLKQVFLEPCTIPVLNNYPKWFSQRLIKILQSYQGGYLQIADIDYLAELQIIFIHQNLKNKFSQLKLKNSNRSKNEPNTQSQSNGPNARDSELDIQQTQSQQIFLSAQSKHRTKNPLVSNWFHFKTYSNLRSKDTRALIRNHKAISSSQVDLQTPFSPQKQSPFNLKANVNRRWFEHYYQK